jgi:hypothetical protein
VANDGSCQQECHFPHSLGQWVDLFVENIVTMFSNEGYIGTLQSIAALVQTWSIKVAACFKRYYLVFAILVFEQHLQV